MSHFHATMRDFRESRCKSLNLHGCAMEFFHGIRPAKPRNKKCVDTLNGLIRVRQP